MLVHDFSGEREKERETVRAGCLESPPAMALHHILYRAGSCGRSLPYGYGQPCLIQYVGAEIDTIHK